AVGRAIMLLEPSFLDQRHQHIGSAHQRSERDDEPGVRANRKADEPCDRRGILRVAAEAIEAMAHQAVGTTIRVAEAEIEIAEHGDTEANNEQRQADKVTACIEQACAIPIQYGGDKGRYHAAAKQSPKSKTLPTSGLWRRPNAKGWNKICAKQQQIERCAGEETCCKNEAGVAHID